MELTAWESFWILIKLLYVPAAIKVYILLQSLKLYGVYNLYQRKESVFNHSIFVKLDSLYTDQELFNQVTDPARREIFKDVFKTDIQGLNDIILSFRETVYLNEGFLKFLFRLRKFDNTSLVNLFLRLYNAHRDKLEKQIRFKLQRGGLDVKRVNYVIQKFYEFTAKSSFTFREKLENIKKRDNLYYAVVDLLDALSTQIEADRRFLPEEFLKLNGRLDNIVYKGFDAFQESDYKSAIEKEVVIV